MSNTQPTSIKNLRALSKSELIAHLKGSEDRNELLEEDKQQLTAELVRRHQDAMLHNVLYHADARERADLKRQVEEQQRQINKLSWDLYKHQCQHQEEIDNLNNELDKKQTKIGELQATIVSHRDELAASDARISKLNEDIKYKNIANDVLQGQLFKIPANSRSDKQSGGSTKS